MNKIIVTTLLIIFSYSAYSQDYYLKIIFADKEHIPAYTKTRGNFNVFFKDQRLTEIFSKYKVEEFYKVYPIADSFSDDMKPAINLRLVFHVDVAEDKSHSLAQLKRDIDALNSADIKTTIFYHKETILTALPNDYYNNNYIDSTVYEIPHDHLDLVNASGAWNVTTGLSCIKIGIVDQDFQHHEDLDNKVDATPRTATIAAASTNDSHGNGVAGMAGAQTNNTIGVASLGYNVRLQYYDLNGSGGGYAGIVNAIYDKCKVVNCSWYSSTSSTLQTASSDIQDVLNLAALNNVTIVAAAGNDNTGNPNDYFYPASYDGVISVTAVGCQWNVGDMAHAGNWKDCHREFFNTSDPRYNTYYENNDKVDLCAPGYYQETTCSNNGYCEEGGTSFASPMVAAAAALLYSVNPFFTPTQIESYLKNYATNIYGVYDNNTWAGKLGSGRLNAGASLQAAASSMYNGPAYCSSCPTETTQITNTNYGQPSGTFYNQNIIAGSNNSAVLKTSTTSSTTFIATSTVTLQPGFDAVPSSGVIFDAKVQSCMNSGSRIVSDTKKSLNQDTSKETAITVYPNPASNIVNILFNIGKNEKGTLEISDIAGQALKKQLVYSSSTGIGSSNVNISSLSPGIYYVSIIYEKNKITSKFLKSN